MYLLFIVFHKYNTSFRNLGVFICVWAVGYILGYLHKNTIHGVRKSITARVRITHITFSGFDIVIENLSNCAVILTVLGFNVLYSKSAKIEWPLNGEVTPRNVMIPPLNSILVNSFDAGAKIDIHQVIHELELTSPLLIIDIDGQKFEIPVSL